MQLDSRLTPKHFFSPEIFDDELSRIFSGDWLFLGHASDLPEKGAIKKNHHGHVHMWLSREGAKLNGVLDSCAHRGAPLNSCNGLLVCPYHGWSYKQNGEFNSIPGPKENWQSCTSDKNLRPIEIQNCGEFLFGRLTSRRLDLKPTLGSFYTKIEAASQYADYNVHREVFPFHANWKWVVENSLDELHVSAVHKEFGIGRVPRRDEIDYVFLPNHSMISSLWEHLPGRLYSLKDYEASLPNRKHRGERYDHYFIFPNTFIISALGLVTLVMKINPLTPTQCGVETSIYLAEDADGKRLPKAAEDDIVQFIRRVIQEDMVALEALQKNMRYSRFSAGFTLLEERAYRFEQYYSGRMNRVSALLKKLKNPFSFRDEKNEFSI